MAIIKEAKIDNLVVKAYETRTEMGLEAAKEAAAAIKKALAEKAEISIIFAAAPSQNEFLASIIADKDIDWTRVNACHMDEYVKLDPAAPQGFGNFLRDRIFSKVPFKSVSYLNGNAEDIEAECERYSALVKDGVDFVMMGIGENGHIAFNDPHVAFFNDPKAVKVVELDQKCRQQQVNDGCFKAIDEVPTHALTLTIPTLFAGKQLFCMVPAPTKADAVYATITGPIEEKCPASILRRHANATLYIEKDSAAKWLAE